MCVVLTQLKIIIPQAWSQMNFDEASSSLYFEVSKYMTVFVCHRLGQYPLETSEKNI